MKPARVLALLSITAAMAASFAPSSAISAESDQADANAPRAWYQASNRVLQDERLRAKLDHEGFPQYTD